MSAFKGEDFEFAAGAIKGMRSWGIDEHCRLHGVTHREVWRPGINASVCQQRQIAPCPKAKKNRSDEMIGELSFYSSPYLRRPPASQHITCKIDGCDGYEHRLPAKHAFDANCECGFWAYDEVNYTSHGDVFGIIEGFGKVTIGTKGFRAEKARIVALCRGKLSLSVWLRLQTLYPDVEFYADRDRMVESHGAVMKSFTAEPDDAFWLQPVVQERDDYFGRMQQMVWGSTFSAPSRWTIGGSA